VKAGYRLYQQAIESEKRKEVMRAKALAAKTEANCLVLIATTKKKQKSEDRKLVTPIKTNQATPASSLAERKSSSEKAGCRLYQQALESEKRKDVLRAKSLAAKSEGKRLVFETAKNKFGGNRNKGFVRLCEMHENGKEKIIADRERYKKKKEEELKLKKSRNLPTIKPKRCNTQRNGTKVREARTTRLHEIYELGKNKIMLDRERYEMQQKLKAENAKLKGTTSSSTNSFGKERQNNLFVPSMKKLGFGKEIHTRKMKNDKENSKAQYTIQDVISH